MLFVTFIALAPGCGSSAGPVDDAPQKLDELARSGLSGKLELTGSSTLAPLAAEIGKRFESLHPDVRVDVQTGGSSRGVADPTSGLADIGMSSRPLTESEQAGRRSYTIARDGVALLVHRNNPVDSLTDEQIVGVFSGRIDNWGEVGGDDLPITVVNRADGRSELELFTEFFHLKKEDIHEDLVAGENQQGIKTIWGDPTAIMYISVGASQYEIEHGAPLKMLPLRGVVASTATVQDGSYPLSRPLIFITKPEVSPLVQAFLDFATSDNVHDLIEKQAYVPVR